MSNTNPDPMRVLELGEYARRVADELTEGGSRGVTEFAVLDALGLAGVTLIATPNDDEGLAIVAAMMSLDVDDAA